jgi:small subunit ribosomal protein S4e
MARGPKKHMKRLNAPKHWMLGKLGGIWAPKASAGPHKERECLPVAIALRNRLKYALTRREVQMICMRRLVKVDGKVRTDMTYPAGIMDVIQLDKTNENFRLLFDHRGKFVLQKVPAEEAKFKLCRVQKVAKAKKASIGSNPFQTGQASAIPYAVTHDGRTLRYPDPKVARNDTVKVDLSSGEIVDHLAFEIGAIGMVIRGANRGRIGNVQHIERHPGSYEIVHMKDKRGNHFATRTENIFVIGDHNKPYISVPKRKGLSYTIIEEKDLDLKKPRKGKK